MMNRVMLRGFVASDPYIRATENGRFARLRLLTIERLTNSQGREWEHKEWHNIAFFGEAAVIVDERVRIGMPISVEGVLRSREWVDKSGAQRKMTEISAQQIELLDAIEGYELPKSIADQMPNKPTTSRTEVVDYEIKPPAEDPDGLPF